MFSCLNVLFFFCSPEQAEGRHDTSSGAGSNQEREVAASAYEAFMVISALFISPQRMFTFKVQLDESPLNIYQHVSLSFLFSLPAGWKLRWLHQTPGVSAGTQQGRLQDLYEQSYCGILQKRSDCDWESKAVTNGDNKKSGNNTICSVTVWCIIQFFLLLFSFFFNIKFAFIFRCTCQQKILMGWMMLKTAYCTTIKPLFTTTCVSIPRPSSSERGSTSFWSHLVSFKVFNTTS